MPLLRPCHGLQLTDFEVSSLSFLACDDMSPVWSRQGEHSCSEIDCNLAKTRQAGADAAPFFSEDHAGARAGCDDLAR